MKRGYGVGFAGRIVPAQAPKPMRYPSPAAWPVRIIVSPSCTKLRVVPSQRDRLRAAPAKFEQAAAGIFVGAGYGAGAEQIARVHRTARRRVMRQLLRGGADLRTWYRVLRQYEDTWMVELAALRGARARGDALSRCAA